MLKTKSVKKLFKKTKIRLLILLLLIVTFTISAYLLTKPKICKDCNVILISIDTLRSDHVGAYGYSRNTTPNIDKFAKDAVVFKNAYSAAPWTLPSHTAVFTSEYPYDLNMEFLDDKLPQSALTLPEVLQKDGYLTHAWFQGKSFVSQRYGFDQGFDGFTNLEGEKDKTNPDFANPIPWLETHKDKKFFFFMHTFKVHSPYCPPKKYADMFKGNYKGHLDCVTKDIIDNNNNHTATLSAQDLKRMVSYMTVA